MFLFQHSTEVARRCEQSENVTVNYFTEEGKTPSHGPVSHILLIMAIRGLLQASGYAQLLGCF